MPWEILRYRYKKRREFQRLHLESCTHILYTIRRWRCSRMPILCREEQSSGYGLHPSLCHQSTISNWSKLWTFILYFLLYAHGRSRTSRVVLSLLHQVPYDRAHKEDDDGLLRADRSLDRLLAAVVGGCGNPWTCCKSLVCLEQFSPDQGREVETLDLFLDCFLEISIGWRKEGYVPCSCRR
jgi:hypothetical protein